MTRRVFLGILLVAAMAALACSRDVTITESAPSPPSGDATDRSPPAPPEAGARCGSPTYPEPDPNRPRYEMSLEMEGGPRVTGVTTVAFTPDLSTGRLVFRLWPNGPKQAQAGARLEPGAVRVDGDPSQSRRPNPTTLVVLLEERLDAGEEVSASLPWTLRLPGPVTDRLSLDGSSYRLGAFFPILPWVPGEGWATDPPTTSFAEANVSPIADFDVEVSVPDGFDVLASGTETEPGHWRAEEVRDFALAAGEFDIATVSTNAPDPVEIKVGVDRRIGTSPDPWAQQVADELPKLAETFGPYPWDTFNLAIMSSLSSAGIEYPTMVFQGPQSLGQTTSHELGHMWFYSLVGTNPARDPWLDEGVTSWAESVVQDSLSQFMSFPIPAEAEGQMGRPMTFWDETSENTYYFGVYAQPVQALGNLGDPDDVNCGLSAYVSAHAFGIAEPEDLLEELDPIFPEAADVLTRFGARF